MEDKKSIVIGMGQVGTAVYNVLAKRFHVDDWDLKYNINEPDDYNYFILHICFPYFDGFEKEVKKYQEKYQPKYTVIHSTVPVGTSRKCGAFHSPVRGMHPDLTGGIRTFVKFIGGENSDEVAEYFRKAGIRIYLCRKPETTELAKLLSTTYYATCIEYIKATEKLCKEHDVPFAEAFTLFQQTYNEGWKKLDHPEYQRPILIPIQRKQGGHCTLPNCELLKEFKFAQLIKQLNKIKNADK